MLKKLHLLLFLALWSLSNAQRDFDKVTITSTQLTNNVYALFGAGGNIGLAIGDQAAYIIDNQFGPLTNKIVAHVKTITNKPIKFVLNTHHHGDHTGGNANLKEQGAVILAHKNVRNSLLKAQKEAAFLPVITFDQELTLHLSNTLTLVAMPVAPAHTNGDTYYYFVEENVIHMGDNFFNARYPYIDEKSGGDIDGLIANVSKILAMVNDQVIIIPGHGNIATKQDLITYKNVLVTLRERITTARDKGASLEAILAMDLSKEWDATWGVNFINKERITNFIYNTAN